NVVLATANGILVQYDRNGAANQELVRIDSATLTFPRFNLSGSISPFDPDGSGPQPAIPGLVVRSTGFTLGQAQLCYGCTPPPGGSTLTAGSGGPALSIGSILTLNDIRVGVTNFDVD